MIGLADVYDLNSTRANIANNLMFSTNVNSPNSATADDMNGYYITRHNPWFYTGTHWRRWSTPGMFYTGFQKFNGSWYHFASNGDMHTGWQKVDSYWYYFNPEGESGRMKTNIWIVPGTPGNTRSTWGRVGTDGKALTGFNKISSDWYCFDSNANMLTSWQRIDGSWFYFLPGSNGRMLLGWNKIDGSWFYFDPAGESGRMFLGWHKIDGGWFYFNTVNESGRMFLGWHDIAGDRYYFNPTNESGRMVVGWNQIDGYWYYFHTGDNGRMVKNILMRDSTGIAYLQANGQAAINKTVYVVENNFGNLSFNTAGHMFPEPATVTLYLAFRKANYGY